MERDRQWTGVSDMTGRGFKPTSTGFTFQTVRRRQGPRASSSSGCGVITLDVDNRFFADNKRLYEKYGSVKKQTVQAPSTPTAAEKAPI